MKNKNNNQFSLFDTPSKEGKASTPCLSPLTPTLSPSTPALSPSTSCLPASIPSKKEGIDFYDFCSTFLPHAFSLKFSAYQKEVIKIANARKVTPNNCKILKNYISERYQSFLKTMNKLNGLLVIEPRDHGKTTRMSQAYPLWLILEKKDIFIVIVGSSQFNAEDLLDSIKFELENNDEIFEHYGEQVGDTWKSKKIVIKNGNSIVALGAGSSMRGIKNKYQRPTHVILEDLLKDQHIESGVQRDKMHNWIKRVILNLGKDALTIIVNTIMHPDDSPSRFFKEIESEKHDNWLGLRFSCYKPDGNPIWKERWSLHELEKKKRSLGSHIFATEWLNEALPEEDRKFKKDKFQFFHLHDIEPHRMKRIMAIDPATGKSTGDYSGLCVTCKDNNFIYVLYADGKKIGDIALIDWIIEQYLIWKPHVILFEDNVFQEIYKVSVLREALNRGITLPIVGIPHYKTDNKFRISKLSPLVESGIVRFQDTQEMLLSQLEDFPKGHDDVPTALEMCVEKHGTNNEVSRYESLGKRNNSFKSKGAF